MNSVWLKLLLLATFAFWASGSAKHIHEQLEHHGHDASVQDDDDDDDGQPAPAVANATAPDHGLQAAPADAATDPAAAKPHQHHVCPVCEMLAHMMSVESTVFPPPAVLSMACIAVVPVPDRQCPILRGSLPLSARGPPARLLSLVAA